MLYSDKHHGDVKNRNFQPIGKTPASALVFTAWGTYIYIYICQTIL